MLTEEHKLTRQANALDFLTRYSEEGDNFLSRVVTQDETWVSHATPESKQQSMEWRHTSLPKKTRFKQTTSTRKIMCTVFWDRKGVLLVDFLPQGSTINASVYCDTFKKLHRAIQNKRRGMLSWGVVMIHDNAHPHTAAAMQHLITPFGQEQFDHPPNSPDLAPSDFHLFLCLKSFLAGWRFHNDEVKEAVTTCFALQAALFYDEGIQKLVLHYDKCLNSGWKVVFGMCIKWQYTRFVTFSCFFLNSPSELTFWITLIWGLSHDWNSGHSPSTNIQHSQHLRNGSASVFRWNVERGEPIQINPISNSQSQAQLTN